MGYVRGRFAKVWTRCEKRNSAALAIVLLGIPQLERKLYAFQSKSAQGCSKVIAGAAEDELRATPPESLQDPAGEKAPELPNQEAAEIRAQVQTAASCISSPQTTPAQSQKQAKRPAVNLQNVAPMRRHS